MPPELVVAHPSQSSVAPDEARPLPARPLRATINGQKRVTRELAEIRGAERPRQKVASSAIDVERPAARTATNTKADAH